MTAGRHIHSISTSWGTPKKYVDAIVEVLGEIDLDPCSNEYSIVPAIRAVSLPENGLNINWNEYNKIYINPPYGKDYEMKTSIINWISKSYNSYIENKKCEIMMLIPVATNTIHWKNYISGKATICFLNDTRLKFLENGIISKKGAPMACSMIYYGCDDTKFRSIFKEFGYVTK